MSSAARVPLADSHREPVPGSEFVDLVHPDEQVEVTVRFRPSTPLPAPGSPHLSHDEFAGLHGESVPDLEGVLDFAAEHGLVMDASGTPGSAVLSGAACDMESAFGVTLHNRTHPDGGTYRTHAESISIPPDLDGVITGVFGLDDRPVAKPHYRKRKPRLEFFAEGIGGVGTRDISADLPSFTPPQLASLYDFPAGDGRGQTIAIIELGGGYSLPDLKTYFSGLGLPMPKVVAVSVDHGKNRPTHNPDGPDGEVMLDIEVAGAIAPKAKIVVYFAPNTDKGFLDAITTAIHDKVNKPSVVSISWGGPESSWTKAAMQAMDQAFQAAAALGVTITVASGDNGSSDGVDDGQYHVDFPASSPHVLACGGTSLVANGTTIVSETVWNDGDQGGAGGGGVSTVFPQPVYQIGLDKGIPFGGRGVPDVAADADPATGYVVRVDGQNTVIGGTSAAAPLLAGLIARLNQSLGKPVGFLNPSLYANPGAFRDITSGNNGVYSAGPGWDACTGLGVADGKKLLKALGG